MGTCLACYEKYKRTQPSTTTTNKPCRLLQSRLLAFTYNMLVEKNSMDGVYCIGLSDPGSGWRCIHCQTMETSRDFSFRVGPEYKVQFQIPLCEGCRLHSVVPNKIYTPEQIHFRSFLQLSIVCDLLDIHRVFASKHELADIELMMVL